MILPLILLALVAGLAVVGCRATRGGYESAPYRVVRTERPFELRDYPALTLVETTAARDTREADDGFMRLFRFITGNNAGAQKISMTTPVFMTGTPTNSAMAFVMPATLANERVPKPADATLKVREMPAGRFAVLRFGGGRNATREAAALERLQAWMLAHGLRAESGPIYGYFDPPWTPSFLRRNEVMLRTAAAR